MENFKNKKALYFFGVAVILVIGLMAFSKGNFSLENALAAEASGTGSLSSISGGVQNIESQLTQSGYPVLTVQKGIPVRWNLKADANSINSCNGTLIIPEFNISKDLQPGDNIIEFTPDQSGVISYSCWMGMISSQINVVDSIDNVKEEDISKLPAIGGPAGSATGCCKIAN